MRNRIGALGIAMALSLGLTTAGTTAHADGETSGARARSARTQSAQSMDGLARRAELLALRVVNRLDAARRERDRVRATCLDQTLSEVHATIRIMRHEDLASIPPARGRVLTRVWTRRLRELDQKAMACERNGSIDASGDTRVITTIDPSVPNIDPTVLPSDRCRR